MSPPVIRIAALLAGLLIIGFSLWWIPSASLPVPQYRTGTYGDYLLAGEMFLAIHGGVLLGVLAYWINQKRRGLKPVPEGIFKAGVLAELCLALVYLIGAGLYGLMAFGSLEKGVGNLWGALLIIWLIFGALVAAGVALVSYGFLARKEAPLN